MVRGMPTITIAPKPIKRETLYVPKKERILVKKPSIKKV